MTEPNDKPLLEVRNLQTHFGKGKTLVKAVDDVSFTVYPGQTVAMVGESGSGKTTVGRTLLRLIPAVGGEVLYRGVDLMKLTQRQMQPYRQKMQMIFQDPASSLNPRMTVGNIVAEPLDVHFSLGRAERRSRVGELLEKSGLNPTWLNRYPHEFSGGQRQRIGIARALACDPEFIVCDEPVSALDVSIQAQILNLLDDLQKELGLSYLFVAHNLAVVEHFSDYVCVMNRGKIVEHGERDQIYDNPQHEYTQKLLSAVPNADPKHKNLHSRIK